MSVSCESKLLEILDGHTYYLGEEGKDIPEKDFLKVSMNGVAKLDVTFADVTQGAAVYMPVMDLRFLKRYNVE